MKEKPVKKSTASLSHIAEAAGVSKMTVSRVLRDVDGFSEATREKVLREVERSGYLPNRLAAAFGPSSASTLIGVCVPRFSSHFFGVVLENIDNTLLRFGYQTLIGCHNQQVADEELWLKNILAWRPAGVLLSSKHHSKGTLKILNDTGIPVVEFWNLNTSPLNMSVGFNEYDTGYDMARYAILKGYKKAALLGTLNDWESGRLDRFKGFEQCFTDAGGAIVHKDKLNDTPGFYSGFYGTENLINRKLDIDMIYFQDDTMALGALAWCQRKGIRVPEDIGIAGWGGHEAASVLTERLSTTEVPMHKIGKITAELMVRKLCDEATQDVTAVKAKLVKGNTL